MGCKHVLYSSLDNYACLENKHSLAATLVTTSSWVQLLYFHKADDEILNGAHAKLLLNVSMDIGM